MRPKKVVKTLHRWTFQNQNNEALKAEEIFNEDALRLLGEQIAEAEKQTSGEIRVHIEDECSIDPVDRAWHIFYKLEMDKTDLRSGIMIYLAVEDHKFAVIGDQGIHQKVGMDFWNAVRDSMLVHLQNGKFMHALAEGIKETGAQLRTFFPRNHNDENELSNDVTMGGFQ